MSGLVWQIPLAGLGSFNFLLYLVSCVRVFRSGK